MSWHISRRLPMKPFSVTAFSDLFILSPAHFGRRPRFSRKPACYRLGMASQAQIAANRLNSQKSTGPRSEEGKAASRFNALKHAASAKSLVIPGEDDSILAELAASYHEQFQPVGPEEALLVEKIVAADWTQRRMHRLEAEVLNTLIARQDESEENPGGAAFIQDCEGPNALQKILRRREAAGREWYRALGELRRLQFERLASATLPVSAFLPPLPEPQSRLSTQPLDRTARPQPSSPRPLAPNAPRPENHRPPDTPSRSTATPGKFGFVFEETTPPAWRL
jgi:hypothetical protein